MSFVWVVVVVVSFYSILQVVLQRTQLRNAVRPARRVVDRFGHGDEVLLDWFWSVVHVESVSGTVQGRQCKSVSSIQQSSSVASVAGRNITQNDCQSAAHTPRTRPLHAKLSTEKLAMAQSEKSKRTSGEKPPTQLRPGSTCEKLDDHAIAALVEFCYRVHCIRYSQYGVVSW